MKRSTFLWLLAIAMVAAYTSVAMGETRITLRENVAMTKNLVRLGDVAEIACDDADEARDLASLPLMPSPTAGKQHFVRQREIEDSLAANGIDVQALTIGGASQVTIMGALVNTMNRDGITVASQGFDRQEALLVGNVRTSGAANLQTDGVTVLVDGVCELISNYLKTKSARADGCTVSCDVAERHLALLATATSRPVCQGGAAPWTGRQRFEISFQTAAGTSKFPVYADVKPAATAVVVALRPMARGEVITAAEVELHNVDYTPGPHERRIVARSIDMLIGMEVRQPIAAGSMVYMESVQPPILVRRGDVIHVSSLTSGIQIRTTARALQDRSEGQLVEVESLTTKERFDARVVGPGEAAIATFATPASSALTEPIETARLR